jgi:hypothetical protein
MSEKQMNQLHRYDLLPLPDPLVPSEDGSLVILWNVLQTLYVFRSNENVMENTQDYWVVWTFPSSGILETREHDVSETGSVSVLR